METEEVAGEYDVVVLGAGSTGENVADRAVKAGLSAAIVEAGLVGGDCSYWACMPSKALLRSPQALAEARALPGSAEAVRGDLDASAVLGRRDRFTHRWDDESQVAWLKGAGIELWRGTGRLAGERLVEVASGRASTRLRARHAVALAVGSRPALPPIEGVEAAGVWTTKDATGATRVPARLLVLGGGVAGCELAQAFARLGSAVTLVALEDRVLETREPFAGELVGRSLRRDGVTLLLGRRASRVERKGGSVRLGLDGGDAVEGDELLVATGRRPRTEDVGLEVVGLEPGGWLSVDASMAVEGVPGGWLYAAGDATGRALLTHQGKYEARICGDAIAARAQGRPLELDPWGRHVATADDRAVPQVVFTDPEVATVGLSASAARAVKAQVRVVEHDLGAVAGAALHGDGYEGRAQVVVDDDRRLLLGATFVGRGVGELLHAATVAVVGEVPLERLWHAVPAYPTISEVFLRLLEAWGL